MSGKPLTLVKPICKHDDCEFLGRPHDNCRAHSRSKKPCRNKCLAGQFVCRFHGGNVPIARERGAQRIALSMAQQIVEYNPNDDETLEAGLLREVRQASQTAQAYAIAVSALQDGLGLGNVLSMGQAGDIKLHALIGAWTKERELHAKLAKMALDAGIAQRQVDLAESQAGILVHVLIQVLQSPALGLTAEQVIEGKIVAAQAMRQASIHKGST